MLVVAFNGSPRATGNTSRMIQRVFQGLESEGIETKSINIGGHKVHGCIACGKCRQENSGQCAFTDDPINDWIRIMDQADGIILASPTYFATVTTEMKALIDRAGYALGSRLYRKVGAPIAVARRGGAIQTYNTLMAFFGIKQMIVPMSSYWNMGYGKNIGEVEQDAEAMETMDNLAKNMAWLLKKLHA